MVIECAICMRLLVFLGMNSLQGETNEIMTGKTGMVRCTRAIRYRHRATRTPRDTRKTNLTTESTLFRHIRCCTRMGLMRLEREKTFMFSIVLGSGSSDIYNTCTLHSHMWLMRLLRSTFADDATHLVYFYPPSGQRLLQSYAKSSTS